MKFIVERPIPRWRLKSALHSKPVDLRGKQARLPRILSLSVTQLSRHGWPDACLVSYVPRYSAVNITSTCYGEDVRRAQARSRPGAGEAPGRVPLEPWDAQDHSFEKS